MLENEGATADVEEVEAEAPKSIDDTIRETLQSLRERGLEPAGDIGEDVPDAPEAAPEVARGILPQSMYTEFIETGSLAAYARICQLRLDPHAQKEIREIAATMLQMVKDLPGKPFERTIAAFGY
jgi:thymidylate synthase ThyX